MSVTSGNYIVYSDLVQSVKVFLKSLCQNINSFGDVSVELKNGSTFEISSQYFPATSTGETYNPQTARQAHTKRVRATVSDSLCAVVQDTKIEEQLNSFLSSRGIAIANKQGKEIVSMKNIMNFYSNIATFIMSRLIVMVGYSGVKSIFYNAGSVSYDSVSIGTDTSFTAANIETLTNDLVKIISKTAKSHIVNISLSCTSCSSSSSSSSSSCSSSCSSSSSSYFIAFMKV